MTSNVKRRHWAVSWGDFIAMGGLFVCCKAPKHRALKFVRGGPNTTKKAPYPPGPIAERLVLPQHAPRGKYDH